MESCDKQLTDHDLPIMQVQTNDTPENQTYPIQAMTHLPSDTKVENSIEQVPTHQRLLKDFTSENQHCHIYNVCIFVYLHIYRCRTQFGLPVCLINSSEVFQPEQQWQVASH